MKPFTLPTDDEQAVISAFARFCESQKAVELDTANELQWFSLTMGFFLASLPDHPVDRLWDVVLYVRHKLGIG